MATLRSTLRWQHVALWAVLLLGAASYATVSRGADPGATSPKAAKPCVTKASSTSPLPGVSIHIVGPACTFTLAEAAAGVQIGYEVRIDKTVSGVVATPQDAGHCDRAGDSGLIPFARLEGKGQSYCMCDTGLCPRPDTKPATLSPGVYKDVFTWSGRNWSGPSDTDTPEGPPFPTGTYTLTIRATGTQNGKAFNISASADVTLVP